MKKRLFSFFLCFVVILSIMGTTVCAAEPETVVSKTEITYFEDGSYLVTEITEDTGGSMARITNSKSGTKTTSMYNAAKKLLFSLTVHGMFTYDGYSALATNVTYSYTIDNSAWSFDSGSCSKSGPKVTATATFDYLSFIQSRTLTVTLTCSPIGTLS